jgi:hypothetical protein
MTAVVNKVFASHSSEDLTSPLTKILIPLSVFKESARVALSRVQNVNLVAHPADKMELLQVKLTAVRQTLTRTLKAD